MPFVYLHSYSCTNYFIILVYAVNVAISHIIKGFTAVKHIYNTNEYKLIIIDTLYLYYKVY